MTKAKVILPFTEAELPREQAFTHLFPGIDVYREARIGGEIDVELKDGTSIKLTVHNRHMGTLYSLIQMAGPSFTPLVGRLFDPGAIGDYLEIYYPDNPRASSISEIYTAVTFAGIPYQMPSVPQVI